MKKYYIEMLGEFPSPTIQTFDRALFEANMYEGKVTIIDGVWCRIVHSWVRVFNPHEKRWGRIGEIVGLCESVGEEQFV